ncbi:MAG: hypothetical protein JOZ39_07580 [Chloroflexi bacterium]|nr:hypothetical protein [Chloroflexota bacterium]
MALALTVANPGSAAHAQAPSCQFILGFKTLHDLDPHDIGECTDNEIHAANGDGQQHSTNGLLAWRKSDDTLVFTNGALTWLLSKQSGLERRRNDERFDWEADAASFPRPADTYYGIPASVAGSWRASTTLDLTGMAAAPVAGPAGQILQLRPDGSWAFAGDSGTWSVRPATITDWSRWYHLSPDDWQNTNLLRSLHFAPRALELRSSGARALLNISINVPPDGPLEDSSNTFDLYYATTTSRLVSSTFVRT